MPQLSRPSRPCRGRPRPCARRVPGASASFDFLTKNLLRFQASTHAFRSTSVENIYIYAKTSFDEIFDLTASVCLIHYKGSAWVPAFAGTHASGKAGQHFELLASIFDRIKKSYHTRKHSLRVQYVKHCQEFDTKPNNGLFAAVSSVSGSDSELHHQISFRSDKSEHTPTNPIVWPRRDVSSAFLTMF